MSSTPYYADEVGHAFANVAQSQTDSSLVSGISGYRIRVLALTVSAATTVTDVTLNTKGSSSGVAISPLIRPITPTEWSYNPMGWCQTQPGESLTVTTGSGGTSGIQVVWAKVLDTLQLLGMLGDGLLQEDGEYLQLEG